MSVVVLRAILQFCTITITGYVDAKAIGELRPNTFMASKSRPLECALYIRKDYFHTVQGGRHTFLDSKWRGSDVKNDDRIMLCFDFDRKRCLINFNEEVFQYLNLLPVLW